MLNMLSVRYSEITNMLFVDISESMYLSWFIALRCLYMTLFGIYYLLNTSYK